MACGLCGSLYAELRLGGVPEPPQVAPGLALPPDEHNCVIGRVLRGLLCVGSCVVL